MVKLFQIKNIFQELVKKLYKITNNSTRNSGSTPLFTNLSTEGTVTENMKQFCASV